MVAGENCGESIILEFWREKHWHIKLLTFSELSGSGIWLGKILANDTCLA